MNHISQTRNDRSTQQSLNRLPAENRAMISVLLEIVTKISTMIKFDFSKMLKIATIGELVTVLQHFFATIGRE